MKHLLLTLLAVVSVIGLRAENKLLHTLYTTDDGLSQNRVMDIEQDQRGFLWFATWDGLNRFDGKHFRVYKGVPGDAEGPDNNRLLSVQADAFGYLWLLTGNGEVYRFNPGTEQFKRLSYNSVTQTGQIKQAINRIHVLKDNKVVFLSVCGCYLLRLNPDGSIGKCLFMSQQNGKLAGNLVRGVFTDATDDVWFLTNTGITTYNYISNRTQHYFYQEKNRDAFTVSFKKDGTLFFGTQSGRVWYRKKGDNAFYGKLLSPSAPITGICGLSTAKLMIATLGDGVYVTDLQLRVLTHYRIATHPALGSDRVNALHLDNDGLVWLDAETTGFVYYDTKQDKLYHRVTQTKPTDTSFGRSGFRVLEGNREITWLFSRNGGLFLFDRTSNLLRPVTSVDNPLGTQNPSLLTDALVDKDGNLWTSTGEPRLEKMTVEPEIFLYTPVGSIQQSHSGSEVRTIFEDNRNRIWVCDKEGKIQLTDDSGKKLGWLRPDGSLAPTMQKTDMMVYDMIQDKKGRIWMACKGVGVVLLQEKKGQGSVFTIRYLNRETATKVHTNSSLCYALLEDTHGRIWVGTFGGGLNLIKETNGSFDVMNGRNGLNTYPIDRFPDIRDLAVDRKGIIWVATDNGLVAFDSNFTNPSLIHFHTYRRNGNDPSSLRANDVHCIHIDKQNNRWFGTFGGGLHMLDGSVQPGENVRFKSYIQKDGLPSDIVLSIEEDFRGFLWLFSENSITRFDTRTFDTDVYNKDFGLDPVMFSESPTMISHKGLIYAGTTRGYYRFNPFSVKKATYTTPLYFTGFYLFDEAVAPNKADGILHKNVDGVDRIVLKKEQSVFSIEFAALDFRDPKNIQYAYKLEPIDSVWVSINKLNRVTFSRLAPGEYTLVVRSTNSEGVWMNNERRLKLVVKPSAWQTGWAMGLYVIIGLLMLYFLYKKLLLNIKSKSDLDVDKKVVEAKKQFLSNVTRELRIPLILIEEPIGQMINDPGLSPDTKNNLSIVQRNIDRMMRLVNRILDFQKNMDRKMTLMVEEIAIGKLCKKIADHFEPLALERGIRFLFNDRSNGVEVYIDKEKFDTILHILLTNAIKFTKGENKVTLSVYLDKQDVVVKVDDEGIGISKENLAYLFDGLNVVGDNTNAVDGGIGIGLSLAKELVELHGGNVDVSSQEGVGTSFELHFKPGKDHFPETGVVFIQPEFYPGEIPNEEGQACMDQEKQNVTAQQPLFMVVEDPLNPEMSISTFLSTHYRVATARNTPQTWNEIDRLMPDFVIIDHDVSNDGGLGLVGLVKGDERTCHIPVVLVAKKSVETGSPARFPEGVDEVITKPFNASYLEARMEHILLHRAEIQEMLHKEVLDATSRAFSTTLPIDPSDVGFLSRVMDFLTENLSNSELTANLLISVIGLGKSAFVSKLRSLLGLSPNELIREIRLKRAMALLESGRYNVSEVIIQVGIKDVKAFSRCFKQHVGLSPYEYRNKAATHQK